MKHRPRPRSRPACRGGWIVPTLAAVLAVLVSAGPAIALDLVPCADDSLSVQIPRGWIPSRKSAGGYLIIEQDPDDRDAPQLMVDIVQGGLHFDVDSLSGRLGLRLGGTFELVQHIEPENALLAVFDRASPPARVVVLHHNHDENTWAVLAMLAASREDFDRMDAVPLLLTIADSVRPVGMELYREGEMALQMPEGWRGSLDGDAVVLRPPADDERIMINTVPLGVAYRPHALAAMTAEQLDDDAQLVDERGSPGEAGRMFIYAHPKERPNMIIIVEPDPSAAFAVLAAWTGEPELFDAQRSVDRISRVARSVRRVPEQPAIAASETPEPVTARGPMKLVVGSWRVAGKDVDLEQGPFAALLEGGKSEPSAAGASLRFEFAPDGLYQVTYAGGDAAGLRVDIVEEGRYRVDQRTLMMMPRACRGTLTTGAAGSEVPLEPEGMTRRKYEIATDGSRLVLRGPCAEYQFEPWCKSAEDVVFPLERE